MLNADSFDYLKEAANLIEVIKKESCKEEADRLESLVEEGATGSEICMALRRNIRDLLVSNLHVSEMTKRRAEKFIRELDSILEQ